MASLIESTILASIGPASLTGSLLEMGILTDSGVPTTTGKAMFVLAGNSTTVTTTIAPTDSAASGLLTGTGTLTISANTSAAENAAAAPRMVSGLFGLAAILL